MVALRRRDAETASATVEKAKVQESRRSKGEGARELRSSELGPRRSKKSISKPKTAKTG